MNVYSSILNIAALHDDVHTIFPPSLPLPPPLSLSLSLSPSFPPSIHSFSPSLPLPSQYNNYYVLDIIYSVYHKNVSTRGLCKLRVNGVIHVVFEHQYKHTLTLSCRAVGRLEVTTQQH